MCIRDRYRSARAHGLAGIVKMKRAPAVYASSRATITNSIDRLIFRQQNTFAIRKNYSGKSYVHLMTTNPNDWIDACAAAGAAMISPHAETINTDCFRTLNRDVYKRQPTTCLKSARKA